MRGCLGASFKRNEVELEAADTEVIPPSDSLKLRSCVAPLKAGTPGQARIGCGPVRAGDFGSPRPGGRGSQTCYGSLPTIGSAMQKWPYGWSTLWSDA